MKNTWKKILTGVMIAGVLTTSFTMNASAASPDENTGAAVAAGVESEGVSAQKSIENCYVSVTLNSYIYDGTRKTVTVVVRDGTKVLQCGTDYTLGGPPIYSGTQPVIIYGTGNYTGSVTKYVTVATKSIEDCNVSVSLNSYVYDGTEKTVTVVVKDGDKTLSVGTDYTVSGQHIYSGQQTIYVYGTGSYYGSVSRTVTIQPAPVSSGDILITPSEKIGYLDPATNKVRNAVSVFVNFNGETKHLTNGSGYTLSYYDYPSGMVSVKVTLTGAFDGFRYSEKFYPTEPAFVWGQDNFHFGNGGDSTGLIYSVDETVFNAMAEKFHLSEAEKTAVRNQITADNPGGMVGRCNGMSTACILAKAGLLKFSDFTENGISLSDIANQNDDGRTMVSVLNFLQEMWASVDYRKIECDARNLVTQNPDKVKQMQGNYIKKIVSELENGDSMLKLLYMTSDSQSHAVTAYAVEPYQYHSDKTGRDYNYRILLCNPNTVLANNALYSEACIYVNKPASGYESEYCYELNDGKYWASGDTNYGGIYGAFKLCSLTDEYNVLNTRYSKCFVEQQEDDSTVYDYRIVVPSGTKRLIMGDANLDGYVDINDCTWIQRYLAEMVTDYSDINLVNSDLRLDGRINVRDVTRLMRQLAGLC